MVIVSQLTEGLVLQEAPVLVAVPETVHCCSSVAFAVSHTCLGLSGLLTQESGSRQLRPMDVRDSTEYRQTILLALSTQWKRLFWLMPILCKLL